MQASERLKTNKVGLPCKFQIKISNPDYTKKVLKYYIQNLCHLQTLGAFSNRSCFQISTNLTKTIIVRPYKSKCLKQYAY